MRQSRPARRTTVPPVSAVSAVLLAAGACASSPPAPAANQSETAATGASESAATSAQQDPNTAVVLEVAASGEDGALEFSVTVQSPDTGCDRYANWWEVVTPQGELIYRRILAHSHIDEQPFTRTGGPVEVTRTDDVIVRVHMNPDGYPDQAMTGSVGGGLTSVSLPGFATELADEPPQPDACTS